MPVTPRGNPFAGPLTSAFGCRLRGENLVDLLIAPELALPVPTASDRSVWATNTGTHDQESARAIANRALLDLGAPWPQPLASQSARFTWDGDRSAWETPAFARQHRLSRAAVAAALTLDDRWLDEVADGVQLTCEQTSWCWPAHDDTLQRHGSILPTVTDPYLDLGAGETAAQLAWLDHLLGVPLEHRYPGIRSRIRHEVSQRIMRPFLARRDWWWIGLEGQVNNWNPWIHSNVMTAALRLLDEPADRMVRAHVVSLAVAGLDRYVASLPVDGAVDEGYTYWWEGAERALSALDLLCHATGGALDGITTVDALRATIAFPHQCHLGDAWFVAIADGQAYPTAAQPWHSLHRQARKVGNPEAMAFAASHRDVPLDEAMGLGRALQGLTDLDWLSTPASDAPLPRDVWFPSTQVMLARLRGGSSSGLTLVAKGGHNGQSHNHNDVGSFMVASDGVPVLIDTGRPTYTAATFGPARYEIWTMQSSWHNAPEVAGCAQEAGIDRAATNVVWAPQEASLSLEIQGAYDVSALRTWRRRAHLDRSTGLVEVTDSWDLGPLDAETTVNLLLAGSIRCFEGGVRITPIAAATPVEVRWPPDVPVRFTERIVDDPMLSAVWGNRLTRLELVVSDRRELVVTVEIDPPTSEDEP